MEEFENIINDIESINVATESYYAFMNPKYRDALERIKKDGICLETYDAIERVKPGTLAMINRMRLSTTPDYRLREVALEAAKPFSVGGLLLSAAGGALVGIVVTGIIYAVAKVIDMIRGLLGMETTKDRKKKHEDTLIKIKHGLTVQEFWTRNVGYNTWNSKIKPSFEKDPSPWIDLHNGVFAVSGNIAPSLYPKFVKNLIKNANYDPKDAAIIGKAIGKNIASSAYQAILVSPPTSNMSIMTAEYIYDKYAVENQKDIIELGKKLSPLLKDMRSFVNRGKDEVKRITNGVSDKPDEDAEKIAVDDMPEYRQLISTFDEVEKHCVFKPVSEILKEEKIDTTLSLEPTKDNRDLEKACKQIESFRKKAKTTITMETASKIQGSLTTLEKVLEELKREMDNIKGDEELNQLDPKAIKDIGRRFNHILKNVAYLAALFKLAILFDSHAFKATHS